MVKERKYRLYSSPQVPLSVKGLILFMARPYKSRVIAFFVLTFFGVTAWVAAPFVVRTLINSISDNRAVTNEAWILVGLFVLVRLLDEWFWRIAEYIMKAIKPQMVEGIRTSLFAAALNKPYTFFVNSSSGRIGHWINQTVSTLNDVIDTTIWGVWPRIMTLILSAVFLFFSHWTLAVLFIVWLVCLFAYTIKRGRVFSRLVEMQSDSKSKVAGRVVDAVSNHMSVRVYNSKGYEIKTIQEGQQEVLKHWHRSWTQHLVTNIVKGHSVALAGGVAMILILKLYSTGQVTVGDVVLFIAYFNDASSSLWELSWQLDQYYNQFGTINNGLKGILTQEDERVGTPASKSELPTHANLSINGLSFAYPEQPDELVLDDITVDVAAGKKIGIVGHSGAGKSTLVGLLLGFYEPKNGSIKINGLNVADKDPSFIRAVSAFVPQDTNLFNRTIRENVVYARPDASDKNIQQALAQAQSLEFVNKLPHGLDTLVGERGVKLSGGQRQRIAIARAILKDAPILILDEATSALDSVSEQAIQKALHELMEGRTAVVIAHRLSTLKHLDQIIVIENGRIVERGTHDELLKISSGIYADLWRRQKDGFIVE